jgi:hypothetical protein
MSHALRAWIVLVPLALAGCGGETKFAPVQGVVIYHNQPLPGGTIVFSPDAERGAAGPLATAEISLDGTFTLHTGDKPGAVPGWHRVTVAPPAGYMDLPRRFSNADQSGQCHEIKSEGANKIEIRLE